MPLSRTIDLPLELRVPLGLCDAPRLAARLTLHVHVPAGIEMPPGDCRLAAPPPQVAERVPLLGLTLRDALDAIVRADPRYAWVESSGVVVMRPLEAWRNEDHFLHATIAALELKDANIGGALDALFDDRWGTRDLGAQIMSRDPSRLTLSLGPVSVIEALDAIVRTHGRLRWEVAYCLPEAAADTAWAGLFADEGDLGLRVRVHRPRDAAGRPLNRCPS